MNTKETTPPGSLQPMVGRLAAACKEEGYSDTDCASVLRLMEVEGPKISVCLLQRRLRMGHHRARTVLELCAKLGLGYYETFEGLVMKSPNDQAQRPLVHSDAERKGNRE